MNNPLGNIRSVVTELETIQQNIGKSQVQLLDVLTDGTEDEWDCPAQQGLVSLEQIQTMIGQVQTLLVQAMPVCAAPSGSPNATYSLAAENADGPAATAAAAAPVTATITTPRALLEARGFTLEEPKPRNGLDASADRAALLLGDNFTELEPFYKAVKRTLSGSGSHWFKIDGLSKETFGVLRDFGARLLANNFLSHFRPHKMGAPYDQLHRPAVYFETLNAHPVRSFFEGGWLERYVLQVLKDEITKVKGNWCEEQFDRNVEWNYPGGAHGEFDVVVSLPVDKLLWLECKTGHPERYAARYNKINELYLKIPREQTALVLVNIPDQIDRDSISELAGMTVIHFSELREWLRKAVA